MLNSVNVSAVILAAGVGKRMESTTTKQLMNLLGHSVIYHTVRAFEKAANVDEIIVVVREEEMDLIKKELKDIQSKPVKYTTGGETRARSAENGFHASAGKYIAIHDGARCLITPEQIETVVNKTVEHGAATAAYKITDTLKIVNNGFILNTVDREYMYGMSTPQAFAKKLYEEALLKKDDTARITDDNMLLENIGVKIQIVDVGKENIKITTREDMEYAEYILKKRGVTHE